jgi:AraC-like DNA-binding protein
VEKTNIAHTGLAIQKIQNVLLTRLTNKKSIRVFGRHSDAFVYVLEGSCRYTFPEDGYAITAHTGEILYLAMDAVYCMDIQTPIYRGIYCDFAFADAAPRRSEVYCPVNSSDTENLFLSLKKHYGKGNGAFQKSMCDLYSIYAQVAFAASAKYIAPTALEIIKDSKTYMESHYGESDLSVATLAARAGISEVYFRKLFRVHYGIAPIQYIKSVRMKKAKEFLKYPFFTIEECAAQSGFASEQYFCREFKKATGLTPLQYRNNHTG